MAYWNRFDIVEAYYLFFLEYHEGQGSKKYRRLCKMDKYWLPSPIFGMKSLSDNAKEIYNQLVEKNG